MSITKIRVPTSS